MKPARAPVRSLADVCRPERMALMVYDMQVGIARQLKEGEALVERVARVVEGARAAGVRIVYLRHTSPPLAWTGAFQLRTAMAWQRTQDPEAVKPWFIAGTPGHAIVERLAPQPDDLVLDKIAMSAFEGTPLAMLMRDSGLDAFALVGAAIEIGIEPTFRHAADLALLPILVRDACAGGHAAAADRILEHIAFTGDAFMTDSDELLGLLQAKAA